MLHQPEGKAMQIMSENLARPNHDLPHVSYRRICIYTEHRVNFAHITVEKEINLRCKLTKFWILDFWREILKKKFHKQYFREINHCLCAEEA